MRSVWPRGGLWRHADFLKLWTAETISQFGSQITGIALPLVAIITLDVTPFEVSALIVIEMAPFLLISLPAGVWVDRLPRKPILVIGDLGRAAALVSIPIAYWADALTIWQLYVVGFVVGIFTVFFDVAYQSYLPSLVEREQLVDGNSKLEISRSAAQLGGPAAAGLLVTLLRAPVAILVDALSFLVSALFLVAIRKREQNIPTRAERKAAGASMGAELREGLAWVLGNPYLRTIAASTATFNFFWSMMQAILLVYLARTLEWSPALIGVIFAVGQVGYLAGALTTGRISKRIGVGPAIVAGAMCGVATILIPLAPVDTYGAIPYVGVAMVVSSFGVVLYNVTQLSMRQAITPERLQGRMNSVIRFIVWGVMPLGALLGGAIATGFELRTAIWIGAVGVALAWIPVTLGPVKSLREVPDVNQGPPERIAETETEALIPGPQEI
ncbi:MAG: Major facilitator superfamily permease [Labilithrix sp.]|nr:Major facilitator superfamily permease [Labilithrix sp.]